MEIAVYSSIKIGNNKYHERQIIPLGYTKETAYKVKNQTLQEKLGITDVCMVNLNTTLIEKDLEGYDKIIIMICPIPRKNIFYAYENENKVAAYTDRPTRCSLWVCEIGIYMRKDWATITSILEKGEGKEAYYVGFDTKKKDTKMIFSTYKYEGDSFPLVPCPYYKWIARLNLVSFYPNDYVVDNGLHMKADFDRHRLVPAVPSEGTKDILYCGIIDQKVFSKVNVGLRVKQEGPPSKISQILFTSNGIECGHEKSGENYVFVYTPDNVNHKKHFKSARKIDPKSSSIYSGEKILVYKKSDVDEALNNHILANNQLEEEYFAKRIAIKPSCIGNIEDVDATLKVKFENTIVPFIKSNTDQNIVKIDIPSNSNQKIPIGCQAVKEGLDDQRFKNFYQFRYQLNLVKKNLNNTSEGGIKVLDIDTSLEVTDIYGYYECSLDGLQSNSHIKSSNFYILPTTQKDTSEKVEVFSISLDSISCLKEYVVIGKLSNYKVKLPSGKEFTKNDDSSKFEDKGNKIIVKNIDKADINSTILSCEYTAFNNPFITIKKTIFFNSNAKIEDTKGKKIIIPIIIGVSVLVIILLVCLVIVSCLRIQKKRKTNLLSFASSATNGSSMSKNSKSQSGLSKGTSSNLRSRSKSSTSGLKSTSKTSSNSGSKSTSKTSSTSRSKSRSKSSSTSGSKSTTKVSLTSGLKAKSKSNAPFSRF